VRAARNQRLPRTHWSASFLLLWQGQLVSSAGDVVYEIALGFWILAVTGSTAIMGALMAATALPRIALSPFAGVLVDRSDRRWMLVASDLVRGLAIVAVGLMALCGLAKVWMVFAAGMVMGACGAIFGPAVASALPDIVPPKDIVKANSAFGSIDALTGIAGNGVGGWAYQVLGAPLLFLLNAISYLYAAGASFFVKLPPMRGREAQPSLFRDLGHGYRFIWRIGGLRSLILIASGINFFGSIGNILILPLFQRTGDLGPAKYGLAMAILTGGFLAGLLLLSLLPVKAGQRATVFKLSLILFCLGRIFFPLIGFFPLLAVGFVSSASLAIVNTLMRSVMQMTTPATMRGKVFALNGMVCGALIPLGMALGGALAEVLPLGVVISGSYVASLALALPLLFAPSFTSFINFDPTTDHLTPEVAASADGALPEAHGS
jgi:MFS transporter, DHA3 family, macrolide efflux protein